MVSGFLFLGFYFWGFVSVYLVGTFSNLPLLSFDASEVSLWQWILKIWWLPMYFCQEYSATKFSEPIQSLVEEI